MASNIRDDADYTDPPTAKAPDGPLPRRSLPLGGIGAQRRRGLR